MITGEQVKTAMIEAEILAVDHHECALCTFMVKYYREGEDLFFDSSCCCGGSGPKPRSWNEAADWINMQSNPEQAKKVAEKFGLKLEDTDA